MSMLENQITSFQLSEKNKLGIKNQEVIDKENQLLNSFLQYAKVTKSRFIQNIDPLENIKTDSKILLKNDTDSNSGLYNDIFRNSQNTVQPKSENNNMIICNSQIISNYNNGINNLNGSNLQYLNKQKNQVDSNISNSNNFYYFQKDYCNLKNLNPMIYLNNRSGNSNSNYYSENLNYGQISSISHNLSNSQLNSNNNMNFFINYNNILTPPVCNYNFYNSNNITIINNGTYQNPSNIYNNCQFMNNTESKKNKSSFPQIINESLTTNYEEKEEQDQDSDDNIDIHQTKLNSPNSQQVSFDPHTYFDSLEELLSCLTKAGKQIGNYIKSRANSDASIYLISKLPPDKLSLLIELIKPKLRDIIVNNNKFCQKFFEKCSPNQRLIILRSIQNIFVNLSFNKWGSYSLQSLIKSISIPEEQEIIKNCIKGKIYEMATGKESNYVLQKILLHLSDKMLISIYEEILDIFDSLIPNTYGIILVKSVITMNKSICIREKILENIINNLDLYVTEANHQGILLLILGKWDFDTHKPLTEAIVNNISEYALYPSTYDILSKCLKYYINKNEMKNICNKLITSENFLFSLKYGCGKGILKFIFCYLQKDIKNEFSSIMKNYINKSIENSYINNFCFNKFENKLNNNNNIYNHSNKRNIININYYILAKLDNNWNIDKDDIIIVGHFINSLTKDL